MACTAPAQCCDEPDLRTPHRRERRARTTSSGRRGPADEPSEQVENGELGWPAPKSDGSEGGDSQDRHLRRRPLQRACERRSSATPRPTTTRARAATRRRSSASPTSSSTTTTGSPSTGFTTGTRTSRCRSTTAHEYNHVLQFSIDAQQDVVDVRVHRGLGGGQVFPDADDWHFYVDIWATRPGMRRSPSSSGQAGSRVYGSAVWNHWLDIGAGYGPDVILDSWRVADVEPEGLRRRRLRPRRSSSTAAAASRTSSAASPPRPPNGGCRTSASRTPTSTPTSSARARQRRGGARAFRARPHCVPAPPGQPGSGERADAQGASRAAGRDRDALGRPRRRRQVRRSATTDFQYFPRAAAGALGEAHGSPGLRADHRGRRERRRAGPGVRRGRLTTRVTTNASASRSRLARRVDRGQLLLERDDPGAGARSAAPVERAGGGPRRPDSARSRRRRRRRTGGCRPRPAARIAARTGA